MAQQEEYYCPNCGLEHRLLRHDTPETLVRCIQCGETFQIKNAAKEKPRTTCNGPCAICGGAPGRTESS